MNKVLCHDCRKTLTEGAKYIPYEVAGKTFAKCAECYERDPLLRNWRETEVYSRVVGYIRPTRQWNKGKKAEYSDRKEYVVGGCNC